MNKNYDDIINLPNPTSKKHKRMSMIDRAAQFSPFAALTGYGAVIAETARITASRKELDEEKKSEIDSRLRLAISEPHKEVSIEYYVDDLLKEGGSYEIYVGTIDKVDLVNRILVTSSGIIPIDDIVEIQEK